MPYDLIREGSDRTCSLVFVLVVAFAGFLSSPDEPPLTLQQYAQQNPVGFVTTAMDGTQQYERALPNMDRPTTRELALCSISGRFRSSNWPGVTIPIDAAHVYVLDPLAIAAQSDPQMAATLQTFTRRQSKAAIELGRCLYDRH